MEYRIIHECVWYKDIRHKGGGMRDIAEFEKKVCEAIEDGWKPQGGVSTFMSEGGSMEYLQAMVK